MAKIGLKYPAAAPITGYDETGMPIYGSGMFIGKGVKADVSYDTADADLYADDVLAEYDGSVTGYSGSLELDGFGTHQSAAKETEAKVLGFLLGVETEEGETSDNFVETVETTGAPAPYLGLAYIKTKIVSGKKYWIVKHCFKTCFKMPNDSSETKGKSVSFGTSSVDFTGMGVHIIGREEPVFTKEYTCETHEKAVALLMELTHITKATGA